VTDAAWPPDPPRSGGPKEQAAQDRWEDAVWANAPGGKNMVSNDQRVKDLADRARRLRDDLKTAAEDMVGTDYEDRLWAAWDQSGDVIEELARGY